MKAIKKIALASGSALSTLSLTAANVMAIDTDIEAGKGYATNISTLFSSVLNVVMLIAALLVFGFLIMGGIEWITSGGDKGKAEGARNKLTAAVIGLVIVAASYAVLTLILNFLGFGDINSVFENVGTING